MYNITTYINSIKLVVISHYFMWSVSSGSLCFSEFPEEDLFKIGPSEAGSLRSGAHSTNVEGAMQYTIR